MIVAVGAGAGVVAVAVAWLGCVGVVAQAGIKRRCVHDRRKKGEAAQASKAVLLFQNSMPKPMPKPCLRDRDRAGLRNTRLAGLNRRTRRTTALVKSGREEITATSCPAPIRFIIIPSVSSISRACEGL